MRFPRAASAAAVSALCVLAGCHGNQSMMTAAGPQSGRIEWLFWVIFGIVLVVFVLTMAMFAGAAARSHTTEEGIVPVMDDDPTGDRHATIAVATAVAVTVITLFIYLGLSVTTGKAAVGETSKNPLTIQLRGHQWWWEVTYPNTQADQTVITANEIHVPVGQPVVILTSSDDVIHSFWAPNITGKRDLLPGYQSAVWIKVDKPGRYRGQCAEYCGYQHAHMAFEIVAEPADKFQQWLSQQVKPAPDPQNGEALRGREVFLTHQCVLCHTVRGTDAGSRVGPDLTHVASRRMIAAGTLPNVRGALAGWITDPQRVKPGTRMPPNPLQPDDLQAIISYLQTLQ
jgi:cytochrome c oxidase subunit 2